MLSKKVKTTVIPAEKMALLVEKGFTKAKLSRAEKSALAKSGLAEFYSIKEGVKGTVPQPDPPLIDNAIAAFFPPSPKKAAASLVPDFLCELTSAAIALVRIAPDWQPESPLFAQRGEHGNSTSFYKDAGHFQVHFKIAKDQNQRSCITVMLTDKLNQEMVSFDAALFQSERCIESVHVIRNRSASFCSILSGDYTVNVATKKGPVVSVNIRLEE